MTCKDCIHFDVCTDNNCETKYELFGKFIDGVEKECNHFKDENKIVELPCKVGDTVYIPWCWNDESGIAIAAVTDLQMWRKGFVGYGTDLDSDDIDFVDEYACFNNSHIGKTVFLTKEEAERALKNEL